MTELHKKLVEMLACFHKFCEKEGLKYYVAGGTTLGAVRHNGFIPWDDDIDVVMPRESYERLKKISKELNDDRYEIEFPFEKEDYYYLFGKMYDKNTTFVENIRYISKRGVYIDIFPLDGVGNDYDKAVKIMKRVQWKKFIHKLSVMPDKQGRKWYKNILFFLIRACLCCFDHQKNFTRIENLLRKYDYETSDYITNGFGMYNEKEIMKKEWMGTPQLRRFENIDVYCPENVDAYLKRLYGDYMQLPPEEKRVPHHNYLYMDLKKSYID